jgi:hypothetical protein
MPEERLPPTFSYWRKLRRTHINLLVEWRRTFRTIASGRGKRTQGSSRSIDRSNHHDEESSTSRRNVCRSFSPIGKRCAVPILNNSLNGAALFGQSHQGGDKRKRASSRSIDRSLDRTRPMKGNWSNERQLWQS